MFKVWECSRDLDDDEAQHATRMLMLALSRWSDGSDLSELRLDKKSISDKNMPEVIEALSRADVVHQLRRLEMRRNKIGYVGASLLSKWMRPECSIEILNMWDNMLGDKGTRALALGLSSASRLRVLNLGSNSISDVGVDALAAAVGNHQCLRTLNLCSNAVSDLGAQALTAALVYNTSIQDVDLTHNASITSRAARHLRETLATRRVACFSTYFEPIASVLELRRDGAAAKQGQSKEGEGNDRICSGQLQQSSGEDRKRDDVELDRSVDSLEGNSPQGTAKTSLAETSGPGGVLSQESMSTQAFTAMTQALDNSLKPAMQLLQATAVQTNSTDATDSHPMPSRADSEAEHLAPHPSDRYTSLGASTAITALEDEESSPAAPPACLGQIERTQTEEKSRGGKLEGVNDSVNAHSEPRERRCKVKRAASLPVHIASRARQTWQRFALASASSSFVRVSTSSLPAPVPTPTAWTPPTRSAHCMHSSSWSKRKGALRSCPTRSSSASVYAAGAAGRRALGTSVQEHRRETVVHGRRSKSKLKVGAGTQGGLRMEDESDYVIHPRASYLLSFDPEERPLLVKRALEASCAGWAYHQAGAGAAQIARAALIGSPSKEDRFDALRKGRTEGRGVQGDTRAGQQGRRNRSKDAEQQHDADKQAPSFDQEAVCKSMGAYGEELDDCWQQSSVSSLAHGIGVALSLRRVTNWQAKHLRASWGYDDDCALGGHRRQVSLEEREEGKDDEMIEEIFVSAILEGGGLSRSNSAAKGDGLLAVDGHIVTAADFRTGKLVSYLSGPAGSTVLLKLRRAGPQDNLKRVQVSDASAIPATSQVFTAVILRGSPEWLNDWQARVKRALYWEERERKLVLECGKARESLRIATLECRELQQERASLTGRILELEARKHEQEKGRAVQELSPLTQEESEHSAAQKRQDSQSLKSVQLSLCTELSAEVSAIQDDLTDLTLHLSLVADSHHRKRDELNNELHKTQLQVLHWKEQHEHLASMLEQTQAEAADQAERLKTKEFELHRLRQEAVERAEREEEALKQRRLVDGRRRQELQDALKSLASYKDRVAQTAAGLQSSILAPYAPSPSVSLPPVEHPASAIRPLAVNTNHSISPNQDSRQDINDPITVVDHRKDQEEVVLAQEISDNKLDTDVYVQGISSQRSDHNVESATEPVVMCKEMDGQERKELQGEFQSEEDEGNAEEQYVYLRHVLGAQGVMKYSP